MSSVELEGDGQRPLVGGEAGEGEDLPLTASLELFQVVEGLLLRGDTPTDQDVHRVIQTSRHLQKDMMSVAHTEQLQDESDGGNNRRNQRTLIDISQLQCAICQSIFNQCVVNVKRQY